MAESTRTKAKTKAKTKSTSKKATKGRAKTSKRKTNLSKLCTEMNKLVLDAVDREIIRRFKIIIDTSEEDITKVSLSAILNDPKNVDLSNFHESLQPYIKHYIFMLKRDKTTKK